MIDTIETLKPICQGQTDIAMAKKRKATKRQATDFQIQHKEKIKLATQLSPIKPGWGRVFIINILIIRLSFNGKEDLTV